MVFQRVQQINQRENEASSDLAPLNGEKQLWEYLLNFCISIEGLTKKKKKEILSYVNSQSETKKILETANQKAGKAVLKTEGIAVPETDRDLGWWITIPNSLLGFNCQRIFHFIIFGSQWYIPYRYTRYTHAYLENAFLQLHLTKRGWILF